MSLKILNTLVQVFQGCFTNQSKTQILIICLINTELLHNECWFTHMNVFLWIFNIFSSMFTCLNHTCRYVCSKSKLYVCIKIVPNHQKLFSFVLTQILIFHNQCYKVRIRFSNYIWFNPC